MNRKILLVLLALVIVTSGLLGACAPAAPKMELPADAIKLSELVPAMGEHWANPAQLPLGPIYLVHDEEVIGIEYMWTEDMMQKVPMPPPLVPELGEFIKALPPLPVGVTVNYVDVAFMPQGHEGFEVPHWDMHMYFIPKAEVDALMPHEH